MIINGSSAMLAETQSEIVAKTISLFRCQLSLDRKITVFSEVCSPSSEPFLRETNFVYYGNKEMRGVSAGLFETGMIQVFAITTTEGDEMLKKLFLLSSSY